MTAFSRRLRADLRGSMMVHFFLLLSVPFAIVGCGTGGGGGGSGPTPPPNDDDNVTVAREIEDADIIRQDGNILYVANPYTGLRLIDVSNPSSPQLLPNYPLAGRTVELFVRDGHAFILTAADFQYCAGEPVGFDDDTWADVARPDYEGTRLWVIDVSDPENMSLRSAITFAGSTVETRRVGDVIYAAGYVGTTGFVQSIDISDADNVHDVQNVGFNVKVDFIHVSEAAVFLVGEDRTEAETSLVTYVDISDPAGAIATRDAFRVRGLVANRFYMDVYQNTFRIVTEEFDRTQYTWAIALYNYDVSNPDQVERIARLPISTTASLRSVRFDGDHAYVSTEWGDKPLSVLDLRDAHAPKIADEISSPGFSTQLYPMGDRLVAVGFAGNYNDEPAVSLYNVSDLANVRLISHLTLARPDTWATTTAAAVDEKAVRILSSADLILMPLARFDMTTGDYVDELQLITMKDNGLKRKGIIDHRGLIRRADLLGTRAWVLSDLAFQVLNIDNLDKPASLGSLDFVTEQDLLDAGLLRCADSARTRGTNVWYGYYGGYGCGAMPAGTVAFTALGIIALGVIRRRRLG